MLEDKFLKVLETASVSPLDYLNPNIAFHSLIHEIANAPELTTLIDNFYVGIGSNWLPWARRRREYSFAD